MDQVADIDPVNVLEDNVVPTVVFSDVEYACNVFMVQPGSTLGFQLEPFFQLAFCALSA